MHKMLSKIAVLQYMIVLHLDPQIPKIQEDISYEELTKVCNGSLSVKINLLSFSCYTTSNILPVQIR